MEWRFFTENALENRRKCSDYKEFFQLRNNIQAISTFLNDKTPPPNCPVYVARILSLRSGLNKAQTVNTHLPETKPEPVSYTHLTLPTISHV